LQNLFKSKISANFIHVTREFHKCLHANSHNASTLTESAHLRISWPMRLNTENYKLREKLYNNNLQCYNCNGQA
jgi:hypothetical protein